MDNRIGKYDELEGIGWEWQSVDGCMVKAPLAREAVGHNPTDRGKNGHKKERFVGCGSHFLSAWFYSPYL